ncbi:MAG: DUF881 domain-containing protein [Egibacteraceae bacterium]
MSDPDTVFGLGQPATDYPAGPPTRWSRPWATPVVTAMTAAGALLVGFLLVAGLVAGRTSALEQDARKAELIALINARQGHTEQLAEQLEELRAQSAAESEVAAGVPALTGYLRQVEQAAGVTGIRGPGMRVTLSDAQTGCGSSEEDCRIQDRDLQLAVNALFAAGAEAIAINGERIIGTTAVRRAGRQVLVNYKVLTPPYVVEAVGNPDRLVSEFTDAEIAHQFAIWTDVYGLGFEMETHRELEIAGYAGSVQLRTAQPSGDGRQARVAEDEAP